MRSNLVVVLSLLVAAPCAYAQTTAPVQDSCETVTTVRCTGSAAPLALPSNQQAGQLVRIAPPVQPQQQPSPEVLPPVPPPPDACNECQEAHPPAPVSVSPPPGLSGHWQLRLTDGSAEYVRLKSTSKASVWGPGLALWLGSYLATTLGGVVHDSNYIAAIPLVGGFASGFGYGLGDGDVGRAVGYTFGSLAQVAGMVTFIAGMVAGPKRMERMPVQLAPLANRDGGGLSLSMKF